MQSNVFSSRRILQVENGGLYTYYYYVYPFDTLTSDTVYTYATTEVGNGNVFSELQAVLTAQTGYPALSSVAITAITPVKPVLTPSSAKSTSINSTPNSITLSGISLTNAGYIWMAVDSSFKLPTYAFAYSPDPSDFKYLLYNTNSYQAASTVGYTAGGSETTLTISGLNSSTIYDVFWFGMNDDPGYRNITTVVYRKQITTPSFGAILHTSFIIFMLFLSCVFF